jgi:hypothetical protein
MIPLSFMRRASTLIELILYMAMTVIIVVGLTTVAARIRSAQSTSGNQTEVQQSVRTALLQLSALTATYETGAVLPDDRFPGVPNGLVLWNVTEQPGTIPTIFLSLFLKDNVLVMQKVMEGVRGEEVFLTPDSVVVRDATFVMDIAENVPQVSYSFIAESKQTTKGGGAWSIASTFMLRPTNVPLKDVCCPVFFKSACSPLIPACLSSCVPGSSDPACLPPPPILFTPIRPPSFGSSSSTSLPFPECSETEKGLTRLLLYDRINEDFNLPDDENFLQNCSAAGAVRLSLKGDVPNDISTISSITFRIRVRANTDDEKRSSRMQLDLLEENAELMHGPVITIDGQMTDWHNMEQTLESGALLIAQQRMKDLLYAQDLLLRLQSIQPGNLLQISTLDLNIVYKTSTGTEKAFLLHPSYPPALSDAWEAVGKANSLLGFWSFEEPSGTIAEDSNGETDGILRQGNSVTEEGPWASARTTTIVPPATQGGASALAFPPFDKQDPVYHFMRIGDGPELNFRIDQPFSFSFWIRPKALDTGNPENMIVFDKMQHDNVGYNLVLYGGTSAYFLQFLWGDQTNTILSPPGALGPDAWSYVIVSYDPTKPPLERAQIIVNGVESNTTQGTKRFPAKPNPSSMHEDGTHVPFRLGASAHPAFTTFTPFQGYMDELRVYNHPVTLDEVSAGMAALSRITP